MLWLHGNGLWGAKMNALHEDLRETDCHLTYLPLFHANAQAYSVLASLWAAAGCVVQPRFSARRFWDVAIRNGCTWTSMVPFMNRALMDRDVPERHPFRLMGNGICSPPTDEIFGVKTIGWWGMTETVTHGFVGDVHLPNRPLSVGKPSVEYDIRVLNEAGAPVGPDETGDLFIRGVRGLSMFAEYLGNEKATAEAFDEEGFFTTGDKITVHSDGFCSFADRAKDMLKVGGENVAASEVERVIAEQPLAREVAVVAKKHPMLDEVPVAYILVDGGAANAPPDYGESYRRLPAVARRFQGAARGPPGRRFPALDNREDRQKRARRTGPDGSGADGGGRTSGRASTSCPARGPAGRRTSARLDHRRRCAGREERGPGLRADLERARRVRRQVWLFDAR